MKKIIVTPAGRKRYLEILLCNLLKCRNEFQEWHIWINTNVDDDKVYIKELSHRYDFIKPVELSVPFNNNLSIYSFFSNSKDPASVYLRLDDDVCYIRPGSIESVFKCRLEDEKPFLIYGNIVNNSVITYLHQQYGIMHNNKGAVNYECMDELGWKNPEFALEVHQNFFNHFNQQNLDIYNMSDWWLTKYERVSINAISWLGSTFDSFGGRVGEDEEHWLSCVKPAELGAPNKIHGGSLFVHFAFMTQRSFLEQTNLLERYRDIANR